MRGRLRTPPVCFPNFLFSRVKTMPQNVTWNGVTYSIPLAGELNWSNLDLFLIALGTFAAVAEEGKQTVRVAVSTPVTVASATDYAVITDLTVPGAVAVNLPAGVQGQIFVIVDGKGDAKTNNITITPNGAETIGGAANIVLNSNRQSVFIGYDVSTTDWKLLEYAIPVGGVVPSDITGVVPAHNGGTGVNNNDAATMTRVGSFDLNVTLAAATILSLGGNFSTSGFPLSLVLSASTALTLPTTGTVATLAGAETLTNKVLDDDHVTTALSIDAQAPVKFFPPTGTDYIGLQAPPTLAATTTFNLPDADGTIGQVMQTDGAGQLSFATVATTSLPEFNIAIGDPNDVAIPTNMALLGAASAKAGSTVVTITNASPGIISWTAHGLVRGDTVYFTTTGALPSPLTPNTTYFVSSMTANDFSVASISGDLEINTTTAGSGVHTGYAGGLGRSTNGYRQPYTLLDTPNGQGSTDVNTRLFTVQREPPNPWGDFTVTSTVAFGTVITINVPGLYYMSYSDRNSVVADMGITKNFVGAPGGQNSSTTIALADVAVGGTYSCVSSMVYLEVGDEIRAAGDNTGTWVSSAVAQFRIFRVF